MDNLRPPLASCGDNQSSHCIRIDWHRVEAIADVQFGPDLRKAIENELDWHSRRWAEYAREPDSAAYRKALEALAALVKAPSAKDRMLPIKDELERVFWFLEMPI